MNFCSHCGSADLKHKIPTGDNRNRFVCNNCHTIHYTNPKVIAGCLPVWEGRVLLARRSIEPRKGFWNVPGGYLENGETVEEGAKREVWEETLARVENLKALSIYSIPKINQIYIHFVGDLISPEFGVGEESLEVELFDISDIPWSDLAFTSSVFSLKRYIENKNVGAHKTHLGRFGIPE